MKVLEFLKWLKLNKNRVAYYENTTCLFDTILHNFTDMDDLVNKLDFDCSKPLAMIVASSLFGVTILGIVLSVFSVPTSLGYQILPVEVDHKREKFIRNWSTFLRNMCTMHS